MLRVRMLKSDPRQLQRNKVKNDAKKSQQEQLFDNAYSAASARLPEPNSSINTDRASRIKNNDFFPKECTVKNKFVPRSTNTGFMK